MSTALATPVPSRVPATATPPAPAATCGLPAVVGADLQVPLVDGRTVRYANLDVAASAPVLRAVADEVAELLPWYSSVHRGAGYASQVCTGALEGARETVAAFVGARPDDVAVFTRNTTDALNLLASCTPGAVLTLDVEHHANLLPWQSLPGSRVIPARATVDATLAAIDDALARGRFALLAVTGASNVTGETLPIAQLVDIAHAYGTRVVVDAAQTAPHRRIDISASGADYVALSGHKLYAPYGTGALVGRRDWLDVAAPHLAGGGAVRHVGVHGTTAEAAWAPAPQRHEAGTPNVLGAAALAAACRTLAPLLDPSGAASAHERALLTRLTDGLDATDGVTSLRIWADAPDRVAVASFVVDGVPAGLVAAYLSAEHGIGVRDGRFCAHPLLARLTGDAGDPSGDAVRASLGLGSTDDDVDRLLAALSALVADGPGWEYAVVDGRWAPTPDPR
ncbi:aminotransferase class V-fold PLP-dependent enzyme [Pseudonocardia sp. KRD291]|uniref:aminotransferase class V-fold PLP-dependent enzyme n=1 Tax=Pseudonocardia sp. KRD291 TaxID=2792007 RepID=UPI001C4A5530|nr:aminotransferase class V-fold PLP-dependent enzyme [Pseudonocardia sp. KRD291]MBW0105642.1 aminotransferase class V-fold PLP-dependent enzyme [Pseudonocardia sp. KRD291]